MKGKEICEILKGIRLEIANANNIAYTPRKCNYQGDDCTGSCPLCEEELRQLTSEIRKKRINEEEVTIYGICSGLIIPYKTLN